MRLLRLSLCVLLLRSCKGKPALPETTVYERLTIISTVSFVSMNWSGACTFLQKRITREIQERLSSQRCAEDTDVGQVESQGSIIQETRD